MASIFPEGELEDAAELGVVDSRGVRVWARQPGAARIDARLEVDGEPPITGSVSLAPETDWTGATTLSLPAPAPARTFTCTVGARRLHGRLAPAPGSHSALTFAFGSCHRPFTVPLPGHWSDTARDGFYAAVAEVVHRRRSRRGRRDDRIVLTEAAALYPMMAAELRRAAAQFLLLVGDQIYSDDLPPISVRRQLPGDEQHPPSFDVALASYRLVSRGYLGQPGFQALRESLPTSMMWDDHDIFDNWGARLHETPLDRRLFEAAARAYCEYQHLRNPGGGLGPPPYHYTFSFGDIGFLVLDVRGARDCSSGLVLGAEQWRDVQRYLAGTEAAQLQTLFLICGAQRGLRLARYGHSGGAGDGRQHHGCAPE